MEYFLLQASRLMLDENQPLDISPTFLAIIQLTSSKEVWMREMLAKNKVRNPEKKVKSDITIRLCILCKD